MELRIKPIESVNVSGCLEMRGRLWPHCSREEHAAEVEVFLADPDRYGQFFASVDEVPGGFVEVSVRRDYVNGTESSPVGFVEGLYVEPQFRRHGVARALVCAAAEWARARGCRELASDTDLANELSQAVHRALGFEETERVVYFRMGLG